MKVFARTVAVAAIGYVFSLLVSCTSSHLVNMWHDPAFRAPPLNNVLVIALRKYPAMRRIWEDAFAGELAKYGLSATPSYSLFPDAPPDTAQIMQSIQANSFDGVLAVINLPTETDTRYVRGYTTTEQTVRRNPHYIPYRGIYWERYRTYYREIEHPGYVDSQTIDRRAIDVSTTGNGGRLIWSATSRTPDPGTVADVQEEIVSLVIAELVKRGIVTTP